MKKKGLLQLPEQPCTTWNPDKKYMMTAGVYQIDGVQIFKATMYRRETKRALYYIFADYDGGTFSTYDVLKEKWREATIINLFDYWSEGIQDIAYPDEYSRTCGARYFEDADGRETAYAIREFQMSVRNWQLRSRHENGRNFINSIMNQAHELPKNTDRFIDNHVLLKSRYAYYTRKGKQIHAFCSHCRTEFTAPAKKGRMINTTGICPHCHSRVIYKSGNCPPRLTDRNHFKIIERVQDGFLIRYFKIMRMHDTDYHTPPETYRRETHRTYITLDGRKHFFEYKPRWTKFGYEKDDWQKTGYDYSNKSVLYTENLSRVFKGTQYQYCAANLMAKAFPNLYITGYLDRYLQYPCMEYLVKMGLTNLAEAVMYGDYHPRGNTPTDILGVSKQDVRRLVKINPCVETLKIFQAASTAGTYLSDEDLKAFQRLNKHCDLYNRQTEFAKRVISVGGKLQTVVIYIENQYKKDKGKHYGYLSSALRDYMDYIDDCKTLELDLKDKSILYPKNLPKACSEASERVKIVANEQNSQKIKAAYPKLVKKYGYEKDGYCILVPASAEEIIHEGARMHHCVGGYVNSMASGRCTILFLRSTEEPDKPVATIEVNGKTVIQIRGKNNETVTGAPADFFEKYKKEVLSKIKEQKNRKAV